MKKPSWLYRALRVLLKLGLELFYIEIQSTGRDHVPERGPIVFAANHPNSIMDTVVLGSQTDRTISYLARSGLFKNPLVAAVFNRCGVIPLYRRQDGDMKSSDNDSSFRAAFDVLAEEGTIGIFPEGRNAPERHVRDIKTGTARIALGAEAKNDFSLGVHVVPVGLNFDERDAFMSRVLVRFGEPIDSRDYKEAYADDPRAAVRAMTEAIQEAIREQAVHIDDLRHSELVRDLHSIYGRELQRELLGKIDVRGLDEKLLNVATGKETTHRDLEGEFTVKQWLADGIAHYEEHAPETVEVIRERVKRYKEHLAQTRLHAGLLARDGSKISSRWEGLKMTVYAIVFAPIALFGLVHNFVPYRVTRRLARKAPDEAMRAIRAFSVGSVLFGLWYALFGLSVYHGTYSIPATALYLVALPITGFWFLRYRRQLARYRDRIIARTLFRTKRHLVRGILLEREQLLMELDVLRDQYREVRLST